MAFGTVEVDTLVTSTKTLTIDDLTLAADIPESLATWSAINDSDNGITLTANVRYLVDSSAASFTANLPASPTAGQFVVLADTEGCFATYPVTIAQNGNNIVGQAADLVLNVDRAVLTLTYSGDATTGWLVK
tara:strand:- start:144 stop:539 length:396 start_codon:yes stop_codon:yes gene_type:complete